MMRLSRRLMLTALVLAAVLALGSVAADAHAYIVGAWPPIACRRPRRCRSA